MSKKRSAVIALSFGLLLATAAFLPPSRRAVLRPESPCDPAVKLPAGFCAVLLAEGLGGARYVAVAPNGDVFASLRSGGVVALRDADGDGRAEIQKRFGPSARVDGILLVDGFLYIAEESRLSRWPWAAGQLEPTGAAEVLVEGLPTGGHTAKTIAVRGGFIYVDIGSATNSCQVADRADRSPGAPGCPELATRAGIWRFRADRAGQTVANGTRFATGTRNPMALDFEPSSGTLWMATHGRDQLGANWGFTPERNAELPAEEFGPVTEGADYGWPFCYYDGLARKKVQAPEYGGDGTAVGDCGGKAQPAVVFPGHWAPMDVAFYTGSSFPAAYRGGAFVSFHGSWNRAPLPQAGFRVAFVPFRDGRPSGTYETFFEGASAPIRPAGMAVGSDGSLYVVSDAQGKVWKVSHTGS
jgi:glucose/arabinose dehydrogenase